jgi:hypothetical protein
MTFPNMANLVLAYDIEGGTNSLLFQDINLRSFPRRRDWLCRSIFVKDVCDFGQLIRENAPHWNPWEPPTWTGFSSGMNHLNGFYQSEYHLYIEGNVKYCLAEETDRPCRPCRPAISPPILLTVLVCNAVKVICFILTLSTCGSMHPLVTNGDAVESFLLNPDARLKDRRLVSKADVKKHKHFWSEQPLPLQWRSK